MAHDKLANFRLDRQLFGEVEAKARREGVSFSEMARRALQREIKETA